MDDNRPNRPRLYENLDPAPRLLMGPGPVDVHPRILRAMSMPMLGQFDPQFTGYMNQVMDLLRDIHSSGATIVMVTHDPDLAARADRNIHLIDGRVAAEQYAAPTPEVPPETQVAYGAPIAAQV